MVFLIDEGIGGSDLLHRGCSLSQATFELAGQENQVIRKRLGESESTFESEKELQLIVIEEARQLDYLYGPVASSRSANLRATGDTALQQFT